MMTLGSFTSPGFFLEEENYVSKLGNFYRDCGRTGNFAPHHTKENVLNRMQN